MTKSYEQLTAQIEKLQREADNLRKKEMADVVAQIRQMMDHYQLTVEDLGLSPRRRRGSRSGSASAGGSRRSTRAASAGQVRFRDEAGNEWTGHGRRPQWFLQALADGKTPEDLAV